MTTSVEVGMEDGINTITTSCVFLFTTNNNFFLVSMSSSTGNLAIQD